MKEELFEVYVRTEEGDTYHTSLKEGLENLLSDDGYRLSINIEGCVLTLRKTHMQVDADWQFLDNALGQETLNCHVTVKGLR